MSSTINAVGIAASQRHATVRGIPNPATAPASLPTSRMAAARDRAQSWRGKYLRALNICPEDIAVARQSAEKAAANNGKPRTRAMSFHRSDYPDHLALSRSYSSSTEKEDEERKSLERSTQRQQQQHDHGHFASHRHVPQQHRIHAVPLRAPSTANSRGSMAPSTATPILPSASNPYGFAVRPNMARGRRCHTDPFEFQERVSAPIQIPSAMGGNNQLDGHVRLDAYTSGGHRRRASPQPTQADHDVVVANSTTHSANVRLLSWEEPVAMLAAADAVSKGWRMPHASAMSSMELGVRRGRHDKHNVTATSADAMHDDDDDNDSHGGDIFAMDESDDEAIDTGASSNQQTHQSATKSRRRYRTESMNIVTSGREKRTHHEYDDDIADGVGFDGRYDHRRQDLSQSFVPPHQLVDRSNCFSIGLGDELKKHRQGNHI